MPVSRRQSEDRLRLTRLARGLSQGDLARTAGVTRQAISGIESGRWSPSLDVALLVAKALDASVEDLFGSPGDAPSVSGRLALDPFQAPGRSVTGRLLLSEVAGEVVVFPLVGDGAMVPGFVPALAVALGPRAAESTAPVSGRGRRRAGSIDAARITAPVPTLAVAGCDPALALLQGPLQRHDPAVTLAWWPCGNGVAIDLLQSGAVHIACIHRRSDARARLRPGMEVVGFASWREGLALASRLRGRVRSLEDVVRHGLRLANRDQGSEARRLLDEELRRLHLDPSRVVGYETSCSAHLLVTSAIASGLADAGVATEPAALAYGLEFIPWQQEISELHVPRSLLGSPEVRALLDVLAGRELPAQLKALEGYDAEPCGRILAA
ncbi:MAG: substrate-binding domain-containing protein [Acidimicrobiales bacterium]